LRLLRLPGGFSMRVSGGARDRPAWTRACARRAPMKAQRRRRRRNRRSGLQIIIAGPLPFGVAGLLCVRVGSLDPAARRTPGHAEAPGTRPRPGTRLRTRPRSQLEPCGSTLQSSGQLMFMERSTVLLRTRTASRALPGISGGLRVVLSHPARPPASRDATAPGAAV